MTIRLGRLVLALATSAALTACTGLREHRGFVLDDQLVEAVQVGVDNKASVEKTLGRPTFTGQFSDNDWYYVSQDTRQIGFRNPKVKKMTALHIRFDAAGNVTAVQTAGKEQMASIDPVGDKTPTLGSQKGFIEELFGNIGTIAQPGLPGSNPQK
jgi:outer membrane protein assembly factor BamE (lipoprotein component of BamABCDE complex)